MSVLLPALRWIGTFLGLWSLVSVVAVVPITALFRLQAASNARRTRDGRRRAWRAAAEQPTVLS